MFFFLTGGTWGNSTRDQTKDQSLQISTFSYLPSILTDSPEKNLKLCPTLKAPNLTFFFHDRCMWPVYVSGNVCLIILFMYTYVCRNMQEELVNVCIDIQCMSQSQNGHMSQKGMVFEQQPQLPDLILRHGLPIRYVFSVSTQFSGACF